MAGVITSVNGHDIAGKTVNRPTNLEPGMTFFDTDLRLPMIYNGVALVSASLINSNGPTLTAVGTNQAGALALTAQNNAVTTAANATAPYNGVSLPASFAGIQIVVANVSANPIQVYGAGADTINGLTNTLGVTQGVGVIATYFCTVAGNWQVQLSTPSQQSQIRLSGAADAISPHLSHAYVVTKAGVDAMTLAAPTAGTDDGITITISSNTANAHTLTATGLLQTGTASVNVATFAAQKGAGLTLQAFQGKWMVMSAVGITFS